MDVNHKDAVALEKMMLQEKDMIAWILEDVAMMNILRQVQSLGLPDWCICAGFVRSKVWDKLHGFAPSRLPDVDVVYFDRNHKEESEEKKIERWLRQLDPSIPWSVKNQARMHIKNGQAPYTSTADGLANFPEVCTAIGVRMMSWNSLLRMGLMTWSICLSALRLFSCLMKKEPSTRSDWRQKSGKQYGHTFVSCADSSMCIGQMFIHASMGVADEKIGAMDSGYILNYMMFFLQRFLLERMR